MEHKTYTRVYSPNSAGTIVSARGANGARLAPAELLDEFRRHADLANRTPTALVSVSSRIVDTCLRAFKKCYEEGEDKDDIWIVFITIPVKEDGLPARAHSAQRLAEDIPLFNSDAFSHEIVFEWQIPEQYIQHRVSLATLMSRGLDWTRYGVVERHSLPNTMELRQLIAADLVPGKWNDPFDIGLSLGLFAKQFGARAPLDWIAHQLFLDCFWATPVGCFKKCDDGIDVALMDWWLADTDFFQNYQWFKEWKSAEEESIQWNWVDIRGLSQDENADPHKVLQLHARNDDIRQDIEEHAIEIGL